MNLNRIELLARLARKIPTPRSVRRDLRPRRSLRPLHDDVSAKDRHDWPAFKFFAFPDRPSSGAVDHVPCHLRRSVEIDDDQIGIRADADRSLFRVEAKNPCGVLTTDLDQFFQ